LARRRPDADEFDDVPPPAGSARPDSRARHAVAGHQGLRSPPAPDPRPGTRATASGPAPEAVDVRLVADAALWAAGARSARDEIFNLTNGEAFGWRDLWPALADELGVEVGPDTPVRLGEFLPAQAAVWDAVVRREGLRPVPLDALLGESHFYADFCFAHGAAGAPPPVFVSTVKIRQAGFGDSYDTELSFRHWLRVLTERRVLPG
jgi:hypothetical protein